MAVQVFLLAVLAFSGASAGLAQVLYGTITGSVTDSTGAVVPEATVAVINRATSQSIRAATNESGIFTLLNVPQGNYDLEISRAGFRSYAQKDIPVTINTVRRVDVTLSVGQVSEAISVQASALALQTDKTDVSTELTSKEVTNLPLPRYRNYQSLVNLVPGATPGTYGNSIQASPGRALNTNVNGVNNNNNANRIDGAFSVFLWLPHNAPYIAPSETVETVNVSTNNFDAEQGMAGGVAVNVTTKSGTNELHGSAFAYHDNKSLQARNFFNTGAKPNNITNINGFTLGGPIRKNRLFFFGGWEGNRERLGFTGLYTLPTEAQRRGDFTGLSPLFDAETGAANGGGRAPIPGNVIPASRISRVARQVQDLLPFPNRTGNASNYLTGASQKLNRDNFDVKINWQRNENHMIWGKYSAMDASVDCAAAFGAGGGPGLCQGNPGVAVNLTQVATLGHSRTISPTFLWDGILGWNRMGVGITGLYPDTNFGLETLRLPGTNGPDPRQAGAPMFSVNGYSAILSDTSTRPAYWNDSTFTLTQNFSWLKRTHDVRFGFEGARHHLNHYQPELGGGPQGRFNFGGGTTALNGGAAPTQFNGYAAFLMGLPESVQKSVQYEKSTAFNYQYALYLRDRWQLSQKLTLTLGLRWEYYPMMTRAGRGGIEVWDTNTNLVSLGGSGGNPRDLGITTSKKMFAPRIGFAYRASQHTVIRSGYGITYNPMPLARPLRGFYPLVIAADFNSPNAFVPYSSTEAGIPAIAGPDLTQAKIPLPANAQMRWIHGSKLERGYVQSWNFIVERELPGRLIGSVGYVGTNTIRSFGDININAAGPGLGNNGRPFAQQFGRTVDTNSWNGRFSANYHSLQTTLNRRVAQGLTLKGAYTWSKAINMADADGWVGLTFNWAPILARNRALAGYDIPHNFQMGAVYELPFGKGKKYATSGLTSKVAGGWQVNGVTAMYKGLPFTVSASGASLNAPGNTQTADQVNPDVQKLGGIGAGSPFFDPAAFAGVTTVRFGTTGRNILRGPGVVNFDMGVFRSFRLTERFQLQFRAESFNTMNTPHFQNPGATFGTGTFLRVTGANQDQRQFRFGLRMSW